VDLESGETFVWEKRANHTAGIRAVGGKLYLTDRRLVFESHRIGRGGKLWSTPLSEVARVTVADRDLTGVFSGGLTNRLRVELAGGEEELFVVRKVAEVAKELSEAAAVRGDN
jgi:hypothetical protein